MLAQINEVIHNISDVSVEVDVLDITLDIVNRMNESVMDNGVLDISRYVSCFTNLSTEFIEFVVSNREIVNEYLNSRHKITSNLSIHQLEAYCSNYLLVCGDVVEPIVMCWTRVSYAMSLGKLELFRDIMSLLSSGYLSVSSIIYISAGTIQSQYISCFLANPSNNIYSIKEIDTYCSIASNNGGGIGISLNNIASSGDNSFQGIVPYIVSYSNIVNTRKLGFKKGAVALYLPVYHKDIYLFLNSINPNKTTSTSTLSNKIGVYICNSFVDAVINDKDWYLFNPADYNAGELYGEKLNTLIFEVVKYDKLTVVVSARKLWYTIAKHVIEFGGPYIINMDASNYMNNQSEYGFICSNLCTEITQSVKNDEISCCNLSQIPLSNFYTTKFDYKECAKTASTIVLALNNLIDKTEYPVHNSLKANSRFESPDREPNIRMRPIGIGISGVFTLFEMMKVDYTDEDSMKSALVQISKSMSCIYFNSILESCRLAKERGVCAKSKFSEGIFQFDLKDRYREYIENSNYLSQTYKSAYRSLNGEVVIYNPSEWINYDDESEIFLYLFEDRVIDTYEKLRDVCRDYGCYNSLLTTIMPTSTSSRVIDCSESIDPMYENLYVNSTGNNRIVRINRNLKRELIDLEIYNDSTIHYIKTNNGSIKGLRDYLQHQYSDSVLDKVSKLENIYFTAAQISDSFHLSLARNLSYYIDQSISFNMNIRDVDVIEKFSYNLLKRCLSNIKTNLYYARVVTSNYAPTQINCDSCIL